MKIAIDSICLPEDYVYQQEAVDKIAESLKEQGLLHPIIVRPLNNTPGSFVVVTGGKRLVAARATGWTDIEAEVRELDDLQSKEVSLHENLKRANLEWFEEVELTRQYHEFQQARLGGVQKPGRPAKGNEGWTMRDTAAALGASLGSVSMDINLAKVVENHPALKKIKDKRTATRIAKIYAQQTNEELEQGAIYDAKIKLNEAFNGDSTEILKAFPELTFDACITDPPWLRFHGEKQLERDETTHLVFKEVFRVLKFNSLLYMFVGMDDYVYYKELLPKYGFKVSKTPLIWIKRNGMSRVGAAPWEYGRNFEFILLAGKGNPVLKAQVQKAGTFDYPVVPVKHMIHPHEKPVSLIQEILNDCTYEGAAILEPFGGSGVVGEACKLSKRDFVIIERDHTFYEGIRRRLGLDGKPPVSPKKADG